MISLEQPELLGPSDRRATVVHPKLGEDVPGVGAYGAQRHHELAGDVWAIQVGSEQPQHVAFSFTQWLDQRLDLEKSLLGRRSVLSVAKPCQQLADVARG